MRIKGTVLLVGGGIVPDSGFVAARGRSDFLLGADGGGDNILQFDEIPDLVVGDLDSLSEAGRAAIPSDRVHRISEQESTDFDKALRSVSAKLVLAIGVMGARLDHGLAALSVLARAADRAVIILAGDDIVFHTPRSLSLNLPVGMRVSLFPLVQGPVRGRGLRWPEGQELDLVLDPLGRIGTSNEAAEDCVEIETDRPGLLTILPMAGLDAAIEGLAKADFHSPPG